MNKTRLPFYKQLVIFQDRARGAAISRDDKKYAFYRNAFVQTAILAGFEEKFPGMDDSMELSQNLVSGYRIIPHITLLDSTGLTCPSCKRRIALVMFFPEYYKNEKLKEQIKSNLEYEPLTGKLKVGDCELPFQCPKGHTLKVFNKFPFVERRRQSKVDEWIAHAAKDNKFSSYWFE